MPDFVDPRIYETGVGLAIGLVLLGLFLVVACAAYVAARRDRDARRGAGTESDEQTTRRAA